MIYDQDARQALLIRQAERERNPMVRTFGLSHIDGAKCKTCKYLAIRGSKYRKCLLRGVSANSSSDHAQTWNACSKYEVAK